VHPDCHPVLLRDEFSIQMPPSANVGDGAIRNNTRRFLILDHEKLDEIKTFDTSSGPADSFRDKERSAWRAVKKPDIKVSRPA
jgi:hypothetical protein